MKRLFSTSFFLVLFSGLFGQATNVSPYSMAGLGDLNTLSLAQNSALGGSTVSLVDSFQLNLMNPASYSFTAHQSPVFDFSFTGRMVNMSTNTASKRGHVINPNNLALVMPFTRRWGTAFGLVTYSNVGYNVVNTQKIDEFGGNLITTYSGSGNINRAFLGTSYMLIKKVKKETQDILSVGVNGSYLFGDIQKKRQIFFPTQNGVKDAEIVNELFARDFMFDGGFIYRHSVKHKRKDKQGNDITRNQQFTIGVSATLGRDTKFQRSVFASTISQTSLSYADTAAYTEAEKGTIYIPARYNFGLTYDFKGIEGSKNYYKLSLSGQYTYQDWTQYKENFSSTTSSDSLSRSRMISFGVQFIPHMYTSGSKFNLGKMMNYRLGFYTGNQYIRVKNNNINAWGVTAGLGIPLLYSASYSMLNISVEYGKRGTLDNNLVLEKFVGIHVGVAFSPSRVERWFVKRKYD